MEVTIISRDTIKPSSSSLSHLKPYKLCFFDQLTPVTYTPVILFYAINVPSSNLPTILALLKKSLSEALTLYYPFSGRIKNNLYIDDFDSGIPYKEATVSCRMSEYLKLKDTESLDKFLPILPYRKETETSGPNCAFQVNIFACGGIAFGCCLSHKKGDGATFSSLIKTWAAIFRGCPDKIIHPNLSGASLAFPARSDLAASHLALMDEMWFKEGNYITKRFLFDAKAIATLRGKAQSENVSRPSRNEVLTGFIWKRATVAASVASDKPPRLSIAAHAVNLRPRMKPQSIELPTGNLFWWAIIAANPTNANEQELDQLVGLLKEVLENFDNDYLETLKGEDGYSTINGHLEQIGALFSMDQDKPDIFAFTAWNGFFNDVDFGWGTPFWIGVLGKVGPASRNLVVLIDSQWGNGIEAWITLEEKQMRVLENDGEFLAFASPNPGISRL
ncbi:hypothetical protein UlMin_025989 [Ulmus minor]